MGSWCLPQAPVLSMLLIWSILQMMTISASCPQCNENAICFNSTHCICEKGFWTGSENRRIIEPHVKCQDIDECRLEETLCKDVSYCRNKIGTYICSCVVKYPIVNWVAAIFDIDHPDCYVNKSNEIGSKACPLGILRDCNSKEDVAKEATIFLQNTERHILNENSDTPIKSSTRDIVYETNKCKKTTILEAGNNTMKINCTSVLKENKNRDETAVAFIAYKSLGNLLNGSFFRNKEGFQEVKLNSHIVSGAIRSEIKPVLSEPVILTLQNTQPIDSRAEHLCVYWEGSEEGGSWSTKGCSHVYTNKSYTICKCFHLSSFAVLVALSNEENAVLSALSVITYVGLSLSLLCLFLAAITFLLCRTIQNTSTTLHLQLSICLFLADLLFLIGINRTKPKINLVFYFQVLWILRSKLSSLNKEVSTLQDTKIMTFKAIVQLFVLGCSWGIGLFIFFEVGKTVRLIFAYLFTIINVLQGVLIFLVHCLLNRQVRMEYKKWFHRLQRETESESTELSHSTTHTKMGSSLKTENFCQTGNLHDSNPQNTRAEGLYSMPTKFHLGAEDLNSDTHAYWNRVVSD